MNLVLGVIVILNAQGSIIGAHAVGAYDTIANCQTALAQFLQAVGNPPADEVMGKLCVQLDPAKATKEAPGLKTL